MEQRTFGCTGVAVPVIGQGTWQMEEDTRAEAIAALRAGLELGLTHIDTAELYGSGQVESLVGEAIRGRRNEVYLVSKVLPTNATRTGTISACERSLERLGTDHLDLYLLHWPGPHPLEETFAAFNELQAAGKIGAFGVSNFDVPRLEAAQALAGPGKLACNQVLYNLLERNVEHAILPWCQTHAVPLVAYSPFGAGHFPGPELEAFATLERIALAHDTTAYAVALAFLVRDPWVFTIPKSSRVAHVRANAQGGALELSAEEHDALDAAFPLGKPKRRLPTA